MKIDKIMTFVLLAGLSLPVSDAIATVKLKPENHIELLFFQEALTGVIKPITAGCYDLALTHVDRDILYFSNSPDKVTGNLSISQFLQTMSHNQKVDKIKPNAVLNMDYLEGNKLQHLHMIGTLSNAAYANKEFRYTFCPFNQNKVVKEGEIRAVSLFIDPIHRWPP